MNGTQKPASKPEQGQRPALNDANAILGQMVQSNFSIFSSGFDVIQDMMAFTQSRIQSDIDLWRQLTQCRNPEDIAALQSKFAATSVAQYTDEMNKLTALLMGALKPVAGSMVSEPRVRS